MRSNFPPVADESNETLMEMGEAFKTYLEKIFYGKIEKLRAITDMEPQTVIYNQLSKPHFTVNGYHPALLIHFNDFVKLYK
jgi:hypothetical protein